MISAQNPYAKPTLRRCNRAYTPSLSSMCILVQMVTPWDPSKEMWSSFAQRHGIVRGPPVWLEAQYEVVQMEGWARRYLGPNVRGASAASTFSPRVLEDLYVWLRSVEDDAGTPYTRIRD